jgi:hypothetical protein
MKEPRDRHSEEQVEFLRAVLEEHTSIDGDVLEVGVETWAIHGVVPYDGESPLAVFDSYDEAKAVLDEVWRIPTPDER